MTLSNRRVLVADDDDVFRNFTARLLASSGYVVAEAQNGATALEKLQAFRPQLLLLDLLMPVVDGWGVIERLGSLDARPRIVLVTGMSDAEAPRDPTRWLTGCLVKPFRARQLLQTCDHALIPPGVVAEERRKEPRRPFICDAAVSSADGAPLTQGLLLDVSLSGARVLLDAVPEVGTGVRVAFALPGRRKPLEMAGVVRWTSSRAMGIQTVTSAEGGAGTLRDLAASTSGWIESAGHSPR